MNAKERILNFLDKQGFYIVLALCLLVISVTAVLSLTTDKKTTDRAEYTFTEEDKGQQANYAGENMVLDDVTTQAQTEKKATEKSKISLARPVDGEIIAEFATDKLIYNPTLKQWTTHEAIDISSMEGTAVKAAMGGTVESVSEDALMGMTVTLSHENGYKTIYSNLSKEVSVSQNDKVSSGQQIGTIGKTAISEYNSDPHLHFEVLKDDKHINPMDYMTGLKIKK